jgi:endonuclease/exonuclease/phosphatase family metal-dependent hydrolase
MVELASTDAPDVLCLQEVPVWALPLVGDWSGMTAFSAVGRSARRPGRVAGWVTRRHQGLFRSRLAGQANTILVARRHTAEGLGAYQLSDPGRERRIVHAVRVGGLGVVANLHATNELRRPEVPREELDRACGFVEALATPGEPVVLAGDFNLRAPALAGYSAPGPGIDHILVRGAASTPLEVWPTERRTVAGVVLSDHAPVELTVG